MLSDALILLAQSPTPKPQSGGGLGSIVSLLPIFLIMYFLLMRPQQKKVKQQRLLMGNLEQGDRVVAAGGIRGTIRRIDDDIISLQVAEGVVLKVDRSSVARKVD